MDGSLAPRPRQHVSRALAAAANKNQTKPKGAKWFVAGELVETSRRFARTIARIQPEWIEPLAAHLVTREYSEPHWDPVLGNIMVFEKISLWGLPIVTRRKVTLAKVDPVKSREMLIQHGLVEFGLRAGPYRF